MTKEAVEAVVGKAVLDSEFREALFANPDEALAEYDLTEEEITALRAIDFETMESFAGTLDERISKVMIAFPLVDGVTTPELGLSDQLAGERPQIGGASSINLPK
jgi:hypothetical protein